MEGVYELSVGLCECLRKSFTLKIIKRESNFRYDEA